VHSTSPVKVDDSRGSSQRTVTSDPQSPLTVVISPGEQKLSSPLRLNMFPSVVPSVINKMNMPPPPVVTRLTIPVSVPSSSPSADIIMVAGNVPLPGHSTNPIACPLMVKAQVGGGISSESTSSSKSK
jgi:hypothetical protein